eukprot:UN34510
MRYFNLCCIGLILYSLGMISMGVQLVYIPVFLISIYFFYDSQSTYEGLLKFFFIYPYSPPNEGNNNVGNQMTQLDKYLWIVRMALMGAGLGSTAVSFTTIPTGDNSEEAAISAFLSAALCEETYKMLFSGSVCAQEKYRNSRYSILHLSIGSAAGFTLFEDVIYALVAGNVYVLLIRIIFPVTYLF